MLFFDALRDTRALAGALSLIIVGAHLSIMMGFYFLPGVSIELLQERWWWEISLNLQIFCVALMWICHHERISAASGWRRVRAMLRFAVGTGGVLVPAFVLFLYAANRWRQNPPDGMQLAYYAGLVFVAWVIAAYGVPLLLALLSRRRTLARLSAGMPQQRNFVQILPFGLLILVAAIEIPSGGYMHVVLWPFFTYLHGAVPYLMRAFADEDVKHAPLLQR